MSAQKYLDLTGLNTYHNEMVKRIADLEYDPERMFDDKVDLFSLQKWGANKYGRVVGLKAGLMITVGGQIWQLENPTMFNSKLSMTGLTPAEKALIPIDQLGWKIVGSNVDFNIDDHVLQLTK